MTLMPAGSAEMTEQIAAADASPSSGSALSLTELEIASGTVLGHQPALGAGFPDSAALTTAPTDPVGSDSPLTALENAMLPALQRTPCLVSFSGGMDSSFVLAVATRAARKHGLADPIPITWRCADAPGSQETPWQEAVLRDLRLEEHRVLEAFDTLDFVGPVAAQQLSRYGLLYPANLHVHLPLLEQAVGGSLLTGVGGDQVLNCWQPIRPLSPLGRVRRAVPQPLRSRWQRLRGRGEYSWLRAPAAREVTAGRRLQSQGYPADPIARMQWWITRRDVILTQHNLGMVAADLDVAVMNPLLDSGFLRALGALLGNRRGRSRAEVLAAIARTVDPSSALPSSAVGHRSKARFGEVFLRRHTRELVNAWDGTGLFETLVDARALRAEWLPQPSSTVTALLVQQLWLECNR